MSTITGYVRIKETDRPIPGLMVSINMREKPPVTPIAVPVPPKPLDRSLGSVITGADGGFQVEFDPPSAQDEKAELMLVVLAPSAPKDANSTDALTPAERTIHRIKLTPLLAKQSEAVVIRIPEDQLRKHQIRLPGDKAKFDVDAAIAQIVAAQERSTQFQSKLREKLGPVWKARAEANQARRRDARKFAANLHMTPKALRSATFVKRGEDSQTAVRTAMELGLAPMSTAQAPPMVIHLSNDELATVLGPGTVLDDLVSVKISRERLCTLLNARRGGSALRRVHELLQGMIDADKDTRGDETLEEETPLAGEYDPAAEISERVRGQLADMPLGAPVVLNGKHQPLTVEQLSVDLPKFKLPAGPADVAAFHDFHSLQIAFRHVWTEAFDEEMGDALEGLYADYVTLHEDYGIDFEMPTEVEEAADIYSFLKRVASTMESVEEPLPWGTHTAFNVDPSTWNRLSHEQRERLMVLANEYDRINQWTENVLTGSGEVVSIQAPGSPELVEEAQSILANPEGPVTRLERLLQETAGRLGERYAFQYFAPNSVNFGILLTYRQLWEPGPYQVGNLVATIPLAPGEKRKFETKQVVKRTRAESELDKALASRSREMSTTQRADVEIVNRASMRSNFQMTAQGSFQIGIADITASSQYSLEQAKESANTKKDFREAVVKAAQEYRNERALEVKTTDELTTETTTSGELSNPNNELTVTYLLYELERQYTISERIHRVTPVILVAQDVPGPHEITESWLLAHEWILRRVLLDDSLAVALDHLTNAFPGEELSVEIRRVNWETRTRIVAGLQATVNELLIARDKFRGNLITSESVLDRYQALSKAKGWLVQLGESLAFDPDTVVEGQAEASIASIKKELDYLEEGLGEKREELALAREALDQVTQEYTSALEAQTNRRVAIDQLRIHVKENILYYMQAIWDHEPPDQRFFRLADVEVVLPEAAERTCLLRKAKPDEIFPGIPYIWREGEHYAERYVIESCAPPQLPDWDNAPRMRLVELADLDRPLGYKGNYIIFPLKTCVYLTEYMMHEFYDDYFGVRDPDLAGNFSTDELVKYTERLLNDQTVTLTPGQREALERMVLDRLQRPTRDNDLVIVPTGQLYMEALLGTHPLLEQFKLTHRAIDVAKARAEWRQTEIENLRRAARLLQAEPNLEDPDIDRHIVVDGNSTTVVETP